MVEEKTLYCLNTNEMKIMLYDLCKEHKTVYGTERCLEKKKTLIRSHILLSVYYN